MKSQDYDLHAVFMRNWDERDEFASDSGCTWEKSWEKVQNVCRMLNIPCQMVHSMFQYWAPSMQILSGHQIDLSKEYWIRVFQPALDLWETGQTPNPDIWCNR
jgi:tRNA-5-taurinomethyluridine 2-sulfurtransferase